MDSSRKNGGQRGAEGPAGKILKMPRRDFFWGGNDFFGGGNDVSMQRNIKNVPAGMFTSELTDLETASNKPHIEL